MARDHARIRLDIWADDDFRDLTAHEQWLYLHLLTSPALSFCGVTDWRPARIAAHTRDLTPRQVDEVGVGLEERHFLIIDRGSEEALIRSFVKHDGLMKSPNMAKALAKAHDALGSYVLRGVVVDQLIRLKEKQPDLRWDVIEGLLGKRSITVPEALSILSEDPSWNPSGNPSADPSAKGSPTPLLLNSFTPLLPDSPSEPTTAGAPTEASPAARSTEFDAFWEHYPRKVGKDEARKRFAAAARKAGAEVIILGAKRLAADPNLPEKNFIPHPSTWLNRGGWDDEPYPPPTGPSNGRQGTDDRVQAGIDLAQRLASQTLEIEG